MLYPSLAPVYKVLACYGRADIGDILPRKLEDLLTGDGQGLHDLSSVVLFRVREDVLYTQLLVVRERDHPHSILLNHPTLVGADVPEVEDGDHLVTVQVRPDVRGQKSVHLYQD